MTEVLVGTHEEINDESVRIVSVGRLEVAVIRHAGKYFAYRNLCPHQGGPACEGIRLPQVVDVVAEDGTMTGQLFDHDDPHIVCPWHGYEFHLSDGTNVCNKDLALQKFEVIERQGRVYVSV